MGRREEKCGNSKEERAVVSPLCDLFLVRHGVTDWNEIGRLMGRLDIGLNARGHAEAEALAEALQETPVRMVVVSPQRRALETAQPIARFHNLAIRTDPGLDEVWVAPHWQGKTWDELRDDVDLQRYGEDPAYTCAAIESAARVQERTIGVAERVRVQPDGGAVVLVSHGDPIKLLLAHYLAMDISAYRRIVINTASVSVLRFSRHSGSRLVALNWKPPGALGHLLTELG